MRVDSERETALPALSETRCSLSVQSVMLFGMAVRAEKNESLGMRSDFSQRCATVAPFRFLGRVGVMEVKGAQAAIVAAALTRIAEGGN